MKIENFCALVFFVFLHVISLAQHVHDTIRLDSVAVCKQFEYFNNGAKREVFDKTALHPYATGTLQTLLQQNTACIIKSYGNGASSNISLRGAGSSQTQIVWEGFPLNSITMGETDISLVPLNCFNSVVIDHSGFSTNYGSGTFGGVVELLTIPEKQKHFHSSIHYTQGNFGTRKYAGMLSVGSQRFQSKTSAILQHAQNNFPYYDYIRKSQTTRTNSEYRGLSINQSLFAQWNSHIHTRAGLWYTSRNLNLPAIMGVTPYFTENQKDTSFKSFVLTQIMYNKTNITIKTAYISDAQWYEKKSTSNQIILSSSSIESTRWLNSIKTRRYISNQLTGDMEFQYNSNWATVTNYKNKKQEQTITGIAAIQYKTKQFQSNILVRKEYNTQYEIPILYTIGVQYYIVPNKIIVRANGGKKYRTPTFNDLYWEQWGNPDLLPESGHTWEIGSQQTWIHTKKTWLTTDISYFEGYIENKIMWTPQGAVWHPMNIAQATIQGSEIRVNTGTIRGNITLTNTAGLDINTSHISKTYNTNETLESIGHQLYYVPKYSFYVQPTIQYKSWYLRIHTMYNSKRYYAIQTSMKHYIVLNANIEHKVTIKKITSIFGISAQNITNTVYESVRSYPLPGRYMECNLQFLIN
ncbi:MAG TPA: TonB-dependent receptor plug domain-containing protein [Bacteroidales bacterium]|nr:TonB-dependent receptor plug domain-containing protein [Bacteroidales bacterium]